MTDIDTIVNSVLLNRGYPVHFYIQFLKYGIDCIRELSFDTIGLVNKTVLEGETEYALPCDYMDWVDVGTTVGRTVKYSSVLKPCNINGEFVSVGDWWWFGNLYGLWSRESFHIEDGKIKVASTGKYIFRYITDGSTIDNATMITPYAQATIEAYIMWKYKDHNRSYGPREVLMAEDQFHKAHARLRARVSDLTIAGVKESFYSGYGRIK